MSREELLIFVPDEIPAKDHAALQEHLQDVAERWVEGRGKHPGAQAVYEGLLRTHKLIHEVGGIAGGHIGPLDSETADKIDDDLADMLDLFAGWCRPDLSLESMVDAHKEVVSSATKRTGDTRSKSAKGGT